MRRRRNVPLRRSTISAMPALRTLNSMKFTSMPGDERTNPVGTLPLALPESRTLTESTGEANWR